MLDYYVEFARIFHKFAQQQALPGIEPGEERKHEIPEEHLQIEEYYTHQQPSQFQYLIPGTKEEEKFEDVSKKKYRTIDPTIPEVEKYHLKQREYKSEWERENQEEHAEYVLKLYNEFRQIYPEFYKKYLEAKQTINQKKHLFDFDKMSFAEIVKNLPEICISKIQIGIAFEFGNLGLDDAIRLHEMDFSKIFSFEKRQMGRLLDRTIKSIKDQLRKYENAQFIISEIDNKVRYEIEKLRADEDFRKYADMVDNQLPDVKEKFIDIISEMFGKSYAGYAQVPNRIKDIVNSVYAQVKTLIEQAESINPDVWQAKSEFAREITNKISEALAQYSMPLYEKEFEEFHKAFKKNEVGQTNEYYTKPNDALNFVSKFVDMSFIKPFMRSEEDELAEHDFEKLLDGIKISLFAIEKEIYETQSKYKYYYKIVDDKIVKEIYNILQQNTKLSLSDAIKSISDVDRRIVNNAFVNAISKALGDYFSFTKIDRIISENGRFNLMDFELYAANELKEFPPKIIRNIVKLLFQNGDIYKLKTVFNDINDITHAKNQKIDFISLLKVLQKFNKLDLNNIKKYFIDPEKIEYGNWYVYKTRVVYNHLPEHLKERAGEYIDLSLRTIESSNDDAANVEKLSSMVHNGGENIEHESIFDLLKNPNFRNLQKGDFTEKLYELMTTILGEAGTPIGNAPEEKAKSLVELHNEKKGVEISRLISAKILQPDFYDLMYKVALAFYSSKKPIVPAMPNFNEIKQNVLRLSSAYTLFSEADLIVEYIDEAEKNKKLPQLFNLNIQVNKVLRFRVLEDGDFDHFRVGAITDCCQRPGGAAEMCVIDSFVNPTAGVVVLEWNSPHSGWTILAQSYFHWAEDNNVGNGFILDNVEVNDDALEESKVNLETVYAYLANQIKDKFDVRFFLAGMGYSKIDVNSFKETEIEEDPRNFSDKVVEDYDIYTDFDPTNCLDLLKPYNKDFLKEIQNEGVKKKEAMLAPKEALRQFRKFAIQLLAA